MPGAMIKASRPKLRNWRILPASHSLEPCERVAAILRDGKPARLRRKAHFFFLGKNNPAEVGVLAPFAQ